MVSANSLQLNDLYLKDKEKETPFFPFKILKTLKLADPMMRH